jgi:hypothetical protein
MQDSPQYQEMMRHQGRIRFVGLLIAVITAVVVALISFTLIPGLQDPETGRLSAGATRALLTGILGYLVSAAVAVFILHRPR